MSINPHPTDSSSWTASAKDKIWQTGSRLFSLFKTYIAAPIEFYAIGDLRTFDFSILTLVDRDDGLVIHTFGMLGSVAIWKPKSKEECARVINTLDQQPRGRRGYRGELLINSSRKFLLSDTTSLAMAHRKEMLKFFSRPGRYAEMAWELIQKDPSLLKTPLLVSMQIIAKGWFGISESTIAKYYAELTALSQDFGAYSMLPLPETLWRFLPSFRQAEKRHQETVEKLLELEIQKIKEQYEAGDPLPEGLLVQEVIKKIKQNPSARDLHKDPDLKSLILGLLASDNLSTKLQELNDFLQSDLDKEIAITALRNEMERVKVIREDGTIDPSILMDKSLMPALDELYLRCLKTLSDKPIVIRYVEKEMECDGYRIPSGIYLAIQSPTETLKERGDSLIAETTAAKVSSSVFSVGKRACPGSIIAEAIFKTIALGFISQDYHRESERCRNLERCRAWGINLRTTASWNLQHKENSLKQIVYYILQKGVYLLDFHQLSKRCQEMLYIEVDRWISEKENPYTPSLSDEKKLLIPEITDKLKRAIALRLANPSDTYDFNALMADLEREKSSSYE